MKRLFLYCAVLVVGLMPAVACAGAEAQEVARPLREGAMVSAVNGKLTKSAESNTWFFTAEVNITDGRGTIKAGETTELLPSSTLERMTSLVVDDEAIHVKLWAKVTRYCNRNVLIDKLPSRKFANRKIPNKQVIDSKFLGENLVNRNFLFPIYFVPLSNIDETEEQKDQTDDTADEESIIPKEVLDRLKPKRVVNLSKLDDMLETEGDVICANRTGFVIIDGSSKTFTIDGLGRNVDDLHFKLLPCETLEATEKKLVDTPIVRQRFRVSGTITMYKGQRYMLLQRATRTYSHGNFAR
jgi:hypothetical protein